MDDGLPLGHGPVSIDSNAFFDYYSLQQSHEQLFVPDELSLLLSGTAPPWASDRNRFSQAPTPPPSIISPQEQSEQITQMEDIFLNAVPAPEEPGPPAEDWVDLTGLALAELDRLACEYSQQWTIQHEPQPVELLNLTQSPPTTEAPSSIFDLSPDLASWASPSTNDTIQTPSTVASTGPPTLPPPPIATPQRSASNGSQVSAASAPSGLEKRKNSIGTKKLVEKKSMPRLIAPRPILPKPDPPGAQADPTPAPKPIRPVPVVPRKVSIKKPRKVPIKRDSESCLVTETASACSDALALAAAYFARGTPSARADSPMEMEMDMELDPPAEPSSSSGSSFAQLIHSTAPFQRPTLERAPPAPPSLAGSTVSNSTTHTRCAPATSASPAEEVAASPMSIASPGDATLVTPAPVLEPPPIKPCMFKPIAPRSNTLPAPATKPRAISPRPTNSPSPLSQSVPVVEQQVSASVPRSFHSAAAADSAPAGLAIPGPSAPPQPVRASSVPERASLLAAPLCPSAESAVAAARKASLAYLAAAVARGSPSAAAAAKAGPPHTSPPLASWPQFVPLPRITPSAPPPQEGTQASEYNLSAAWLAATGTELPVQRE